MLPPAAGERPDGAAKPAELSTSAAHQELAMMISLTIEARQAGKV